ncbi:MAG: xanthine dehydrogenase family protein subunit M, partial [Gammaproteobacteria bacterium]|nr:xanthine dehydrogenase family protein subunit M [Gammaproteobacteria bacterium]
MYPAPFRYHRPASLAEAIRLLSELGDGAKPLAGGQTLIPILKLRMDEPSDLVDIARLPGLRGIRNDGAMVRIGALATHANVAMSDIGALVPIVRDCAGGIADPQVRARGTIGGSVCAADPSSDWSALLHALDAVIVCHGPEGERVIAVRDFIVDAYTTALNEAEIVTEIRFGVPAGASGGSYIGFKKAAPAYPAAAAGVQIRLADGDVCEDVRLVLGAAGPRPVTCAEAEALLRGKVLTRELLERSAEALVERSDPPSDARGSAAFKKTMLRSLFVRAAETALRRAQGTQIVGSHDYV